MNYPMSSEVRVVDTGRAEDNGTGEFAHLYELHVGAATVARSFNFPHEGVATIFKDLLREVMSDA